MKTNIFNLITTSAIITALATICNAGSLVWSGSVFNSITGETSEGSWQGSWEEGGFTWVPGNINGTAMLYALGNDWRQFGDGNFDFITRTLTSNDGTVFGPRWPLTLGLPVGFSINGYIWYTLSYPSELDYPLEVNESGIQEWFSPLNQWYAVVFVDDATPGHYGIDVFHAVFDCDESWGWNAGGTDYKIYNRVIDAGQYTVIPEPATTGLMLTGVAFLFYRRKRITLQSNMKLC